MFLVGLGRSYLPAVTAAYPTLRPWAPPLRGDRGGGGQVILGGLRYQLRQYIRQVCNSVTETTIGGGRRGNRDGQKDKYKEKDRWERKRDRKIKTRRETDKERERIFTICTSNLSEIVMPKKFITISNQFSSCWKHIHGIGR